MRSSKPCFERTVEKKEKKNGFLTPFLFPSDCAEDTLSTFKIDFMMTLKPATEKMLANLDSVDLFTNVGKSFEGLASGQVILIDSWDQAIRYCLSPEWENLINHSNADYRKRLFQESPVSSQKWNPILRKLKPIAFKRARQYSSVIAEKEKLPACFKENVEVFVLGLVWELEYSDVITPGLYTLLSQWYIKGHFPCGWIGNEKDSLPPHGKFVIY